LEGPSWKAHNPEEQGEWWDAADEAGYSSGEEENEEKELEEDIAALLEDDLSVPLPVPAQDVDSQAEQEPTEVDPSWEMLQAVRIAAEALLQQVAIVDPTYWSDQEVTSDGEEKLITHEAHLLAQASPPPHRSPLSFPLTPLPRRT
jgi:hypothetical protein